MHKNKIHKIIIVGGGTAGWMTAAALSRILGTQHYQIRLIESDQIGTVGVGEATLPHLRFFNRRLGISESEFMRATSATFKAGIEFSNWGNIGEAYIHPFGDYGTTMNKIGFHHYWLKARALGLKHKIDDYSLPVKFCEAGKFDFPSDDLRSIQSTYSYAYHIDAGQYARFLRTFSEQLGVMRTEGKVEHVLKDDQTGNITSLLLESGELIQGDLFIDCSGFRSILLGKNLNIPFESWKHWLPCDRAIAAPTELKDSPLPYTKAMAQDAGWQWRIPLQHRMGNGYVYSSAYSTDERADIVFRANALGSMMREPIHLRFEAGKRAHSWEKNCVAIGLSAGFLEPLESTSIYLIQTAIMKLVSFFSDTCLDDPSIVDEFNRQMNLEYERTRDFLILHYHATERSDSEFWNHVRTMQIPESLSHKMALFKASAYVSPYAHGLFLEPSWLAVYLGQGIVPSAFDPRVAALSSTGLIEQLGKFRMMVEGAVANMSDHDTIIKQVCRRGTDKSGSSTASMSLYGRRL